MSTETWSKQDLREALQSGIATVVFTKADGSERTLNCTLKQNIIPVVEKSDSAPTKAENPDVLAVWDIENSGWRSFRLDSIISTTITY